MRTMVLADFAKRLAAVRLAYGVMTGRPTISRAVFAAELALEQNTYRRYERGEMEPSMVTLVLIRRLTGISLDYLIAGENHGIADPAALRIECTATFAERVRCARELFTDEISEVAAVMEVSETTIRRWEDGREPMTDAQQLDYVHRFRISLAFLRQGLSEGLPPDVLFQLRAAHPELWRVQTGSDIGTATVGGTTAP